MIARTLLLAILCLPAACSSRPGAGYTFENTYPADVRSVRVPIFRNQTTTPGVEVELTEAIIKQIQKTTDLRVIQSQAADSELTGVVTTVRMRRLSLENTTGLVQELSVEVTIDFDWKDARSGRVFTGRRNFTALDTFVPAQPTGELVETGRHGAIQRLAQDVVHEMRSDW